MSDDLQAHARRSDPQTSHDAAASIRSASIETLRALVMQTIEAWGACDDTELVARIGRSGSVYSPSGIRTRRRELTDDGLIVDTGMRVKLASGRMAIVWDVPR